MAGSTAVRADGVVDSATSATTRPAPNRVTSGWRILTVVPLRARKAPESIRSAGSAPSSKNGRLCRNQARSGPLFHELLNLTDGVLDLHVEDALAQVGRGSPAVARHPVG